MFYKSLVPRNRLWSQQAICYEIDHEQPASTWHNELTQRQSHAIEDSMDFLQLEVLTWVVELHRRVLSSKHSHAATPEQMQCAPWRTLPPSYPHPEWLHPNAAFKAKTRCQCSETVVVCDWGWKEETFIRWGEKVFDGSSLRSSEAPAKYLRLVHSSAECLTSEVPSFFLTTSIHSLTRRNH